MNITRALLLSSKKQAASYEPKSGLFSPSPYYFFVTDCRAEDCGLRFQIFRMIDEEYADDRRMPRTRRKTVETPHVDKAFKDEEELANFLRSHQIDVEENWFPVED